MAYVSCQFAELIMSVSAELHGCFFTDFYPRQKSKNDQLTQPSSTRPTGRGFRRERDDYDKCIFTDC